jgi:S1-C subfamily serine protease
MRRRQDVSVRGLICAAAALALASFSARAAENDVRRTPTVVAVEQVLPCVVNIATETIRERHDFYEDLLRHFYGVAPRKDRDISLGSGVIFQEDGYILTNLHVVRRANRIQVKLWDGREYEAERVVDTERSDVAMLKIKAKPGEKFKAVKFAQDDDLMLGESVIALGNPYGLGGSVSHGILSSKNRRPPTGNEPLNVQDWLQTDAAINPGNSGGPLINLRGELIGLNVAILPEGQGIGFAIPVKQVAAALTDALSPESSDSLWFGVHMKSFHAPLQVASVQMGSPADKAGLRVGDQVVEVNGRAAEGLISFNRQVSDAPEHQAVLKVKRGAEQKEISVRLLPLQDLIREKLGLSLLELTEETASRFNVNAGEALFIEEVDRDGPADKAKLQRGFLLMGIDGHGTGEIKTVAALLAAKKKGDPASLSVIVPRRRGANFLELRQGTAELRVR